MKVSVITLFHNRRELSARYLADWREAGVDPSRVELLWGDSASTDGTRELLLRESGAARLVCFDENLGFAAGNNALAALATGEILLFLNNDVAFCPDWLGELLAVLEARPDAGMVGNLQLHVSGRGVHHAGMFFAESGVPYHWQPPLHALDRLRWMPVPAVTGCCLAMPRELFLSLGGFDTAYRNGYEDTDLCLRVRAAGREILCSTRSVIWHHVCSSPGRHARDEANEALFLSRHAEAARALSGWRPPQLQAPAGAPSPLLSGEQLFQVFYPSEEAYSQGDSLFLSCPSGPASTLTVALGAGHLSSSKPLRLDPPSLAAPLSLLGASLVDVRDGALLRRLGPSELAACCAVCGDAVVLPGEGIQILATGADPQLLLRLPRPAGLADDAPLLLVLSLGVPNSPATAAALPPPPPVPPVRPAPSDLRRILVDLRGLVPGGANGGVKPFVLTLLRALERRRPDYALTLAVCPEAAAEIGALFPGAGLLPLPAGVGAAGQPWPALHDVLYSPIQYSTLSTPGLRQVGLVVDLLHRDLPGMLPDAERHSRESWQVAQLASCAALQCNSDFVVAGLARHYGIDPATCFVVHNAIQGRLRGPRAAALAAKPGGGRPYFLYPANDWPHKNHARLLAAYAAYRQTVQEPWDLVLTGHFSSLGAPGGPVAGEGVRLAGYLSEDAYATLFLGASALVFPSLYEGFGIPVLEALSQGIPVACSRRASLPSVGGEACLWFDPELVTEIHAALHRLHTDGTLRAALSAAGPRRAALFDLDRESDLLALRLDSSAP